MHELMIYEEEESNQFLVNACVTPKEVMMAVGFANNSNVNTRGRRALEFIVVRTALVSVLWRMLYRKMATSKKM